MSRTRSLVVVLGLLTACSEEKPAEPGAKAQTAPRAAPSPAPTPTPTPTPASGPKVGGEPCRAADLIVRAGRVGVPRPPGHGTIGWKHNLGGTGQGRGYGGDRQGIGVGPGGPGRPALSDEHPMVKIGNVT